MARLERLLEDKGDVVYEAPYAIPELGIKPGDLIIIRPSHPRSPFITSRHHHPSRLPLLLEHLDHLNLVELSGAQSLETLGG